MQTERPLRPPADRVAPELAMARLDLRQISLVALSDGLDAVDRQRHGAERRAAESAAADVLRRGATRDDRSPAEVARAFFGLYFVFPNLGLAGPFFGGDVRPLKETAWVAAYDAVRSGVCVRAEFHARLWEQLCDEDRRARAAGMYVRDRSLHSVPPRAHPRPTCWPATRASRPKHNQAPGRAPKNATILRRAASASPRCSPRGRSNATRGASTSWPPPRSATSTACSSSATWPP